jgi:hypothetical protein
MAWYRAGTVSVTNNSSAVTGAGTAWVTAAAIGETFLGPDGQSYEIVAINSATSLTIAPVYKGSTASAQGYAIMPTQGYLRDLAAAAAALVESYASVKNNAGTGKFAAGTSANPSLRNAADENTGLNLKGNDQLALVTAGVERLALSASGVPSGTAVTHMLDRANHTGTQLASSISNFSAASLIEMQKFGLGGSAGVLITNLETHRTSGAFLADSPTSTAAGLPLSVFHIITYRPGTSAASGEMWATPLTSSVVNGGRVWFRKLNGGVWQAWKELAFTDSPTFTGTPSASNIKLGNVNSSDANTLDYYEEGSWTPYLRGSTTTGSPIYVARYGEYTKIGDIVHISGQVQLSSKGGMDGELKLEGLPFNSKNIANHLPAVSLAFQTGIDANLLLSINRDSNQINIYKRNGASTAGVLVADVSDTFRISFSATYKAT